MLPRTSWLLPLLLAFPALPLLAQEGLEEKQRVEQRQQNPERGRPEPTHKAGDTGDGATREEADGATSPRAAPAEAVSNACSVLGMVNPPRLAPGESGTLTVICALQHRAVIQADAGWKVTYEPSQGGKNEVQLGAWTLKPAGLGTLEERFKGKPVYDNQAQVLIPITIAAGTPYGKYRVTMRLEVPLTDGSSGQQLGLFRGEPGIDIQVGASMPRPVVRGAAPKSDGPARGPSDVVVQAVGTTAPGAGQAKPSPTQGAAVQGGTLQDVGAGKPNSNPKGSEPEAGPTDSTPTGSAFPMVPVAVGGALLLALILLLARKKR